MVKRLRDLNNSIKNRVTFDRDAAIAALDEGIDEEQESLVQTPVSDVSIRRVSQDYDREEADRQFVRRKLAEMQNQTKRISFGQAFKNARAAGKKTFWWKGKEYNTKIKSEANTKGKSVINKKSNISSNTSSNTSSNKNVGNKIINNNVTNNKQSNTTNNTTNDTTNKNLKNNKTSYLNHVKQVAKNVSDAEKKQAAGINKQKTYDVDNIKSVNAQVAERRRLNNRSNQLSSANDFTAYQDYRNNYDANVAKGYLDMAMQKSKTSPAFTSDEIKIINRAEANKRKRNR